MTTANDFDLLESDVQMSPSFEKSGTPLSTTTDDSSKINTVVSDHDHALSFPSPESILFEAKCIEERVENGLYNSVATQMLANRHGEALCEAVYNQDFEATLDKNRKNTMFVDKHSFTEYKTLLFGEIDESTIMSAKGNHWCDRNNPTPLKDSDNIKDVLVIRCPTLCDRQLANLFHNQLATIFDIRNEDAQKELAKGIKPDIRLWTKCAAPDRSHDQISIHLDRKYGAPVAPSPHTIRSIQKRPVGAELSKECKPSVKEPKKEKTISHVPSGSEIFLGASYEPTLVYDCRGPYFHLVRNKLRQLDIRNKTSQLIPPWRCYDELRPGTLILIKATLHVFVFMDNQENIKKKVYQLNGQSVRVIADSNLPVPHRHIPVLPGSTAQPNTPSSATASTSNVDSASLMFDSFVVSPPKKKAKTE